VGPVTASGQGSIASPRSARPTAKIARFYAAVNKQRLRQEVRLARELEGSETRGAAPIAMTYLLTGVNRFYATHVNNFKHNLGAGRGNEE
jgi:hypothetical protein